jgi:hypothetical protein
VLSAHSISHHIFSPFCLDELHALLPSADPDHLRHELDLRVFLMLGLRPETTKIVSPSREQNKNVSGKQSARGKKATTEKGQTESKKAEKKPKQIPVHSPKETKESTTSAAAAGEKEFYANPADAFLKNG